METLKYIGWKIKTGDIMNKKETLGIGKARIKPEAPSIFMKKCNKMFSSKLPKSYHDYYTKLIELAGKELEILSEYDNRIVLKYDNPEGNVIGIDLEKDLVEKT